MLGDNGSWNDYIGKNSFFFTLSGIFMDLFSIINIIVLLNLLISLIGDIYDKVQENQMPNDAIERCDMMRKSGELNIEKRGLQICPSDNFQ